MYNIEVTDTYGGESNYSWVKRGTTKAKSRRGVVKAVKDIAGWTDWCRVRVIDFGDIIEVRPTKSSGVNQVAFAQWSE